MMCRILIVCLLQLFTVIGFNVCAQGYTVSPGVPDFTNLSAPWVVATTGSTSNPLENIGVILGRHTIVTRQGTDPNTGNILRFLPEGESKIIRLGNEMIGAEAESVTYHFKVDAENSVLLVKFAVVFQDPGHAAVNQPRFVMKIMDKAGNLIDPCASYDVTARPGIDGFNSFEYGGVPVRWRDWTNVGLDMSAYAGQEVQVQFVTYDCVQTGHFGYAYFTASCVSKKLSLQACNGKTVTLAAPKGFASYLWSNDSVNDMIRYTVTGESASLSCKITSATGCQFIMGAYLGVSGNIPPLQDTIYDVICEGDGYDKNCCILPPQNELGTFRYENTFFDLNNCSAGRTVVLNLTVQRRYYKIKGEVCEGYDYRGNGFEVIKPSTGIHYFTNRYERTGKCDSVVVLELTVKPPLEFPDKIFGSTSFCMGTSQIYSVRDNGHLSRYQWTFPQGVYILSGENTSRVTVVATDEAVSGVVNFYGINACGDGTLQLDIEPDKAYWQTTSDTVCVGVEYHGNDFHIPVQDSAGYYSFSHYFKTKAGCDSIHMLYLSVFDAPTIYILPTDTLICDEKVVTLHAVKDVNVVLEPPLAGVGDILCTDGSVVKAADYGGSGKTAWGVVFWVDDSVKSGWAVHLQQQHAGCEWGEENIEVPGLKSYGSLRWAQGDTSGYKSTKLIRDFADSSRFPAAYQVDFDNGWYLPACGQLDRLYTEIFEVNESLALVGGDLFEFPELQGWRLWSSTQYTTRISPGGATTLYAYAWGILYNGELRGFNQKNMLCGVRAVRTFSVKE